MCHWSLPPGRLCSVAADFADDLYNSHRSVIWCTAACKRWKSCWGRGDTLTVVLSPVLVKVWSNYDCTSAVVMYTGDEVVDADTAELGPGQIRDCNRSMLLAAAAAAGAEAVDLGIARDVEGHLEGCVDRALQAGVDVLVTSGADQRFADVLNLWLGP